MLYDITEVWNDADEHMIRAKLHPVDSRTNSFGTGTKRPCLRSANETRTDNLYDPVDMCYG